MHISDFTKTSGEIGVGENKYSLCTNQLIGNVKIQVNFGKINPLKYDKESLIDALNENGTPLAKKISNFLRNNEKKFLVNALIILFNINALELRENGLYLYGIMLAFNDANSKDYDGYHDGFLGISCSSLFLSKSNLSVNDIKYIIERLKGDGKLRNISIYTIRDFFIEILGFNSENIGFDDIYFH